MEPRQVDFGEAVEEGDDEAEQQDEEAHGRVVEVLGAGDDLEGGDDGGVGGGHDEELADDLSLIHISEPTRPY